MIGVQLLNVSLALTFSHLLTLQISL